MKHPGFPVTRITSFTYKQAGRSHPLREPEHSRPDGHDLTRRDGLSRGTQDPTGASRLAMSDRKRATGPANRYEMIEFLRIGVAKSVEKLRNTLTVVAECKASNLDAFIHGTG